MEKVADISGEIAAIVLAAGMSTRMGRQKLLLPWNGKTIIEAIILNIKKASLNPIIAVTGKNDWQLNSLLKKFGVHQIVNPDYLNGSMLVSLQKGILATNNTKSKAFMIFLGDQPSVQVETIQEILKAYENTGSAIIVPSYQFHMGHPWLVDRKLWSEILQLSEPFTLRDFLRNNKKSIQYVTVNSETILQDIDTPEQYSKIITS